MNADTGQIHQFADQAAMRAFIDSIPFDSKPVHGFVELGNMPSEKCECCKGTGVARILPGGRRIPCKCTNPS